MTLDQIVKLQSVIDKRAIRSDTLEFLNEQRFSESKQKHIRYGDMHIDHFLRVYESLFIFKKPLQTKEDKTEEMFESIKKRILQEFSHGNN